MPNEAGTTAGGLGQPSKRGRPRKTEPDNGIADGATEHAGRDAEPIGGVEATSTANSGPEFDIADPRNVSGGDGGDKPRRGRKPGGKNRAKEEAVPNLNLSSAKIEDLLITACFFLGNSASCPEIYATEEEAKKVADAYREFAKYHSVGITEKRLSEINMIIAAGAFGGPRVMAWWRSKPKPLRPRLEPTPIRSEPVAATSATQQSGPYAAAPAGMVNGLANPVDGTGLTPEQAQTPSQMWNQPGDIQEID